MGIDIDTYRCRVGMFVPHRGAGQMCMSFYFDFCVMINFIGTVNFVRLLLIIAGTEQNPGPADKFIFRYQYLLVQLGTDVLRQLFDVVVDNNVVQYLTAKNRDIQCLIEARVITADQKQFLPNIDNQPDSRNFDIILLSCLLRNICGLRQPKDPVWINPASTDTSIEADIARLRMCRNQLMHIDKLVLPEAELEFKWQHLSGILLRLNKVGGIAQLQSDINNAEHLEIDEHLSDTLNQIIKAWHESDRRLEQYIYEVKQDLVGEIMRQHAGKSILRYRHMVIDMGTKVLRQLFNRQVGEDFGRYLDSDTTQSRNLLCLMKYLSVDQQMLLPPLEKNPVSSKFDLTLLTHLLRNVCGLRPPTDHVWQKPESTDESMEADITRLSNYRNEMMHGHTFLPEKELNTRIKGVTLILQRLSSGNIDLLEDIIDALCFSLDDLLPDDYSIRGNISNQPLEPLLPGRTLIRLTSLSLFGIKMEHNSLKEMVTHLSNNVRIENINFSYVSCNHHQDSDTDCTLTLNLQNNAKLNSLCLYGVNIVCDRVNRSSLQSIKLYPISKRVVDSYINVFNCIKDSHLEHLDIYGSLARYDGNTLESLTCAVKTLRNIKSLKLSGINLPDDVSLQLHPDVTHMKIVLEHVTMSEKCFQSFTSNCVEAISEAHIELDFCTIKPVGEINSCFEEHENSVNGATEISHMKSWQNTVRCIYKYFTADVQVTHQDDCCLHFKSVQRD